MHTPNNGYPGASNFGFGTFAPPSTMKAVTPLPQNYGTVTPVTPPAPAPTPPMGQTPVAGLGYEDPKAQMSMMGPKPSLTVAQPTPEQIKTGYEDPGRQQSIMGTDQASKLREDIKESASTSQTWGSIADGLSSASSQEGMGAKIGGGIGTAGGAAIGAYFGNPAMGAQIGSAVGQFGGGIVDFFMDMSEKARLEEERELKKKQAEKMQAMADARTRKLERREDAAYAAGLDEAARAKALQIRQDQAVMAKVVFDMMQARQRRRGLGGYGINEIERMGQINPLRQRTFN